MKLATARSRLLLPRLAGRAGAGAGQLKVAIGQIKIWSGQAPMLGQKAGIFKKHGIVLENVGTAGAGETVQAVIAGSADFGVSVGAAGVLRAFAQGAPIRVIGANFTGTGDIYWYVRANSPIKSLKDATEKRTISFSTNGASTHTIVLGFVKELGVKAVPTATGGMPATLTQVMSGQIDIGWGSPPFGMREIKEGKIRVIVSGNDAPSLRGQTIRIDIVNANALKNRKDAALRFVQGVSRDARLDVFRSEGDQDVRRGDQGAGLDRQDRGGEVPAEGSQA